MTGLAVDRDLMIVSSSCPALPSRGHPEQLARVSEGFARLLLETADMRVV
jgi:hypothetical protein